MLLELNKQFNKYNVQIVKENSDIFAKQINNTKNNEYIAHLGYYQNFLLYKVEYWQFKIIYAMQYYEYKGSYQLEDWQIELYKKGQLKYIAKDELLQSGKYLFTNKEQTEILFIADLKAVTINPDVYYYVADGDWVDYRMPVIDGGDVENVEIDQQSYEFIESNYINKKIDFIAYEISNVKGVE